MLKNEFWQGYTYCEFKKSGMIGKRDLGVRVKVYLKSSNQRNIAAALTRRYNFK